MKTMKNLLTPRRLIQSNVSDTKATITISPLERGYGHTLGHTITSVLLSSLPGAAVVAIDIEGVKSFDDQPDGIVETVQELVLNLKSLAVELSDCDEATLTLYRNGAGPVTAADFMAEKGVSIIDPGQHIANLTSTGRLNVKLQIRRATGSVSATGFNPADGHLLSPNCLFVDNTFSPCRLVRYSVANCRVEQRTNLDELIFEIETNGALSPRAALKEASMILMGQLSFFADELPFVVEPVELEPDGCDPILLMSLDEVGLSLRSLNLLKSIDLNYVGDLATITEVELLEIPSFGMKSLTETRDVLGMRGLKHGTQLSDWPPSTDQHLR